MLDFAVINQKEKNFTKEITRFELMKALEEVVEIMKEKITMKNIAVTTQVEGHSSKNSVLVVSDKMRLQ